MNTHFYYPHDTLGHTNCKITLLEFLKQEPNKETWFIFASVREEYDYGMLITIMDDCYNYLIAHGYKNVIYFVNNTCPEELRRNYVKVIEWFALDLEYRIHHTDVKHNSVWNANSDRGLFLNLKANKPQRVGLLYKFVEANLIEKLDYSFHPYCIVNNTTDMDTEKMYSIISKKNDFAVFAKKYARSIDNIVDPFIKTNEHVTSGYPYDINIYKNTSVSVVSETLWGTRNIFLTEKAWKPIINHHPFVMAGQPNTLKFMKNLGFKTFDNYLKITDYDQEEDHFKRLSNIVENTKFFLDNKHLMKDDIERDIAHNFYRFFEMCREQNNKFNIFDSLDFYKDFYSLVTFKK